MKTKYHPSRKEIHLGKEGAGFIATLAVLVAVVFIPIIKNSVINSYAHSAWFVREFTFGILTKVFNPWGNASDILISSSTLSADITILQTENDNLKAMLGRRPDTRAVLARVLVKPPQSPYDEITVDVGNSQNIEDGAQVYDENGSLIGSVVSTSKYFSTARLFSSPGLSLEAEILNSGDTLTLTGQGDGSFVVKVPRNFSINIGDIFILPGLKNRPLATVVQVVNDSDDSFQTVYAKGFFVPRSLTWVFVESHTNADNSPTQ